MPPPSLFFIFDLYRCRYTCRRLGGEIRDSLSLLSQTANIIHAHLLLSSSVRQTVEVLEKMAGCLTPSSKRDDQWLCLHDVDPAFEMFFLPLLSSYMGFCGLSCVIGPVIFSALTKKKKKKMAHKRGGTRAPLYIYEKLQRHVSSPLLPTICYQRLIKMLTNTRDPSCVWRGFLSLLFFLFGSNGCCCFSSSSCAGCGWASSK